MPLPHASLIRQTGSTGPKRPGEKAPAKVAREVTLEKFLREAAKRSNSTHVRAALELLGIIAKAGMQVADVANANGARRKARDFFFTLEMSALHCTPRPRAFPPPTNCSCSPSCISVG
jgi:hypothetical protein